MWSNLTTLGAVTNAVALPEDGQVSLVIPDGIKLSAYINGSEAPMHHLHVKSGDNLLFKLVSHSGLPGSIEILYNGVPHVLHVMPEETLEYKSFDRVKPVYLHESNKMTPAETINLFANPNGGMGGAGAGAGAGAGLGAGLLGGVLGGALLGNRGILGNGNSDVSVGTVTPALLASSLAQVTDTSQTTTILQTLGDIKASIPLAEGQVQLALAGVQSDINRNISTGLQVAIAGQSGINKNISDSLATAIAGQGDIKASILTNSFAVAEVVRNDGDKTRALIVAQNDAMLNRQLAVAEAALLEQRAIGRSRDVEVNVTQTVNQNQVQLQAQAQQQQQFLITNNLLQAILSQAQVAQATNQSLIIGNSGITTGGPQTANPVNVRA